ncbi:MAG TPA: hypothetical protein ACFCUD_09650 [Cyclobacteriaceae bacterium]
MLITISLLITFLLQHSASEQEDWMKVKEDFHMALALTFHPAEEGNLQPLKDDYKSLVKLSSEWKGMPLPRNYKNPAMRDNLILLHNLSKGISELIKENKDESLLMEAIIKLHDQYHKIEQMIYDLK